tara:strand:- start:3 stop:527 length:525 start_codon:yes stop_codon:yes gene_type:complete
MKRKTIFVLCLLSIFFVAIIFYLSLKNDPKYSTKNLVNLSIPEFSTKTLMNPNKKFSNQDLSIGRYSIINIWASWCKPCRDEHPILMKLSQVSDLDVYGINFKDKSKNAIKFLNKLGNPYIITGIDKDGTLSINFGAYGVPETILIDKNNKILLKYIGPLNEGSYTEIIEKIRG